MKYAYWVTPREVENGKHMAFDCLLFRSQKLAKTERTVLKLVESHVKYYIYKCSYTEYWPNITHNNVTVLLNSFTVESEVCVEKEPKEDTERGYPITSVCKDDIRSQRYLTRKQIKKLDGADMRHIAEKMADSYTGNDTFWIDLEIIAKQVAEES